MALTDYEKYIRTDELLALQKPADCLTCHDELQFQVVHQAAELRMKLIDVDAGDVDLVFLGALGEQFGKADVGVDEAGDWLIESRGSRGGHEWGRRRLRGARGQSSLEPIWNKGCMDGLSGRFDLTTSNPTPPPGLLLGSPACHWPWPPC